MVLAYLFAGWTLAIWASRIRNVVDDGGGAGDLLVPVALTVLAVATILRPRLLVPALAAVTVLVWLVRVPLLLGRDHTTAFVVVHLVLAVVSVGLAVAAYRAVSRSEREARTEAARPG